MAKMNKKNDNNEGGECVVTDHLSEKQQQECVDKTQCSCEQRRQRHVYDDDDNKAEDDDDDEHMMMETIDLNDSRNVTVRKKPPGRRGNNSISNDNTRASGGEEILASVTTFGKEIVKAATAVHSEESYFQQWDIDSMKYILAKNNVQIRGANAAPHAYFVMICDEVFAFDNQLPELPRLPSYDELEIMEDAAYKIQRSLVRSRKDSSPAKHARDLIYEYSSGNNNNNTNMSSSFIPEQHIMDVENETAANSNNSIVVVDDDMRRLSQNTLSNAKASMFDESSVKKPQSFAKLDQKDFDEEIEVEWRKPSWKYAKKFETESKPHQAGKNSKLYDWKHATLGRHCIFGGCGEQLDLWNEGQISEFAQYGSGITNYFKFLKWCCWIMVILSGLQFPTLIVNLLGSSSQYDNAFSIASTTIGNLGSAVEVTRINIPFCDEDDFQNDICNIRKDRLGTLYTLLDVVGTVIVIFGFVWLRLFERKEEANLSRSTVKASDYTICVRNIPGHCSEAEIKAHFAKVTGEAIASVSIAFSNSKEIEMYIKRGVLMKRRFDCVQKIRYEKTMEKTHGYGACNKKHLSKMMRERAKLTRLIRKEDAERLRKVGLNAKAIQAFVTFQSESGMLKGMRAYSLSWFRRTLCCFPQRLLFRGKKLIVDKAPEPSTILWENLEYSFLNRMFRKCLTTGVAFFAIFFSVIFTFKARDFQNRTLNKIIDLCPIDISEDAESCYCSSLTYFEQGQDTVCREYLQSSLITLAISYGAAIAVTAMNVFFKWLMNKAGSFERHHSIDQMETSIMIRVFLLKFVNTGCLVLLFNQLWLQKLVNIKLEGGKDFDVNWYETGGVSITLIMVMSIFTPHIGPLLAYKRYRSSIRTIEKNLTAKKETSDAVKVWYTQDELNEAYIGPVFQMNYRYAQLLVSFYICWMYAGTMPLLPIIGAFTFYLSYWVDKFLFCRFYRTPPMYSAAMGKMCTNLIGFAVIIHLMMSIWMLGNKEIFRSRSIRDTTTTDYHSLTNLDIPIGTKNLEQEHIVPILGLLLIYTLGVCALKTTSLWGLQVWKLLRCLTCSGGVNASRLEKQKRKKYLKVDFSRATDRGMIKGLASYNVLQNSKYQNAFGISKEFALNKTRLSHIEGLNTKDGELCTAEQSDVEFQCGAEKSPQANFDAFGIDNYSNI